MKKWVIILIVLVVLVPVLLIIYNLIGTNSTNIKSLSDDEKNQLLQLIDLQIESPYIEFEKIEVPKTYKDIYYSIYFNVENSQDKNLPISKYSSINKKSNNIDLTYYYLKSSTNRNYYYCNVSNQGENLEFIEELMKKY